MGGGRGEVDLEGRIREDDGAHVTAIRHQSRQSAERELQVAKRGADCRQGGDSRGEDADGLRAQRVGDVGAGEGDAFTVEPQVEAARDPRQGHFVVRRDAGRLCGQPGCAIERSRIEIVIAERARDGAREGALAGGGRANDSDEFVRH